MTYGNLANAINAQVVHLWLGDSSTGEFITLNNISKVKDVPVNRVVSRSGAADFYSAMLIEFTAEAVVSDDVYNTLDALSTPNSVAQLTEQVFTVNGQNLSGNDTYDITQTFTGQVRHMEDIAGEAGHYTIRFTVRILNSSYTPS
jgi:hypothetical protein